MTDRLFGLVGEAAPACEDPQGVAEVVSDFFTGVSLAPDLLQERQTGGKVVLLHEAALRQHIDRRLRRLCREYRL